MEGIEEKLTLKIHCEETADSSTCQVSGVSIMAMIFIAVLLAMSLVLVIKGYK